MGEFLDNYVRLGNLGIRPFFCVDHGQGRPGLDAVAGLVVRG